jgi:hypothetical protein
MRIPDDYTATGSETGSWVNDGFQPGMTIRIEGTGVAGVDNPSGYYKISTKAGSVTDLVLTLTDDGGNSLPTVQGTFNSDGTHTVSVEQVNQRGLYTNNVEYSVATVPFLLFTGTFTITGGNTITRSDIGSFVNDNCTGRVYPSAILGWTRRAGQDKIFQIDTVATRSSLFMLSRRHAHEHEYTFQRHDQQDARCCGAPTARAG